MASITEERALSKIEENLKTVYEKIGKKYYEEKMIAEYKLLLNKVVDLEDKFLKDFSKDK